MPLPLLLALACTDKPADDSAAFVSGFTAEQLPRVLAMSPLPAPRPDTTNRVADDPAAARLGQFVYFDTRFSGNNRVACATCHDPAKGFTDQLPLSEGISTTGRHAPSVFNTVYNRWFFWDGRADSHWAQALGPLESAVEHGGSRLQYAHVIYADPALREAYEGVFGELPPLSDLARFPRAGAPVPEQPNHPYNLAWEGMTADDQRAVSTVYANLGKSIAAYERLVVSGRAPIDDFVDALVAEDTAGLEVLSESAREGLALFAGDAGCHFCHSGATFTDLEFHNIGLPLLDDGQGLDVGRYEGIAQVLVNEFNGTSAYSDDPGGYAETKLAFLFQGDEHYGQFKTPGLREVALTAPFMHDGRFETLTDVVNHYNLADTQPPVGHREEIIAPLELDEQQVQDIVTFLEEALTGAPPDAALLSQPASPLID